MKLFVLLCFVVCSMSVRASDYQQTLVDTVNSISMKTPNEWIGIQREAFLSARLEFPDGRTQHLLTVMVEELSGARVRLDQFRRIAYETHLEHHGKPARWFERDTAFRGMQGAIVDLSYPLGGDGEQILVRRLVFIVNRKAFILTGEARSEDWPVMLTYYEAFLKTVGLPSQ